MEQNKKLRHIDLIKLLLPISLTSFSVLTLEITYSRILSVMTYYHFSSMIISIALLGFGAAGAYLSVEIRKNTKKLNIYFLERNLFLFFVSIIFGFYLITKIRFFPLNWNIDWTNQLALVFFYILIGLPFYFAGLVLSLFFSIFPERANLLYFSDLIGAGFGSIGSVILFQLISAPLILHFISILGLIFIFLSPLFSKKFRLLSLFFCILFLFFSFKIVRERNILIYPPPSKSMSKFVSPLKRKNIIEYSKWNIIEKVDVTKSLKIRVWGFGGEISSLYKDFQCELRYIFKDGIMSSGIIKINKSLNKYNFLSGYIMSAPYYLNKYKSAIIIGPGGGIDILIALYHGIKHIIGVEINPVKVNILKNEFYKYSGKLTDKCILIPWEGRHFFSRYQRKVDVIETSGLDEYPALSSGAFAMSENYILTVEAISSMLNHLTERGVISITRIYFDPPRETLRLVTTAKEALRKNGISNPSKHFVVIKGKKWTNTLIKRTPFTDKDIENLNKWVSKMKFDFLYLPYQKSRNPIDKYLRLPKEEEKTFVDEYPYKISPVTDNSPFFFQYYKWKNLFKIKVGNWVYEKLMPIGLKIVIFSLIQITVLGIGFIIIPLLSIKMPKNEKWYLPMTYFASIGLGYILIEIVLIQKFNYFLGGPVYALAVTLCSLLTFSGIGSFFFRKRLVTSAIHKKIISIIIIIGIIYIFLLNWINIFLPFNRTLRIFVSFLIIGPLGFFMGVPFPFGIKILKSRKREFYIPWAWGVNSVFTVFGSIFCLLISLNYGFNLALALGICSYAIALVSISLY